METASAVVLPPQAINTFGSPPQAGSILTDSMAYVNLALSAGNVSNLGGQENGSTDCSGSVNLRTVSHLWRTISGNFPVFV